MVKDLTELGFEPWYNYGTGRGDGRIVLDLETAELLVLALKEELRDKEV